MNLDCDKDHIVSIAARFLWSRIFLRCDADCWPRPTEVINSTVVDNCLQRMKIEILDFSSTATWSLRRISPLKRSLDWILRGQMIHAMCLCHQWRDFGYNRQLWLQRIGSNHYRKCIYITSWPLHQVWNWSGWKKNVLIFLDSDCENALDCQSVQIGRITSQRRSSFVRIVSLDEKLFGEFVKQHKTDADGTVIFDRPA